MATDAAVSSALGIHKATWVEWKNAAAAGDQQYIDFFADIETARGKVEAKLLKKIMSSKDWRAAAFVLKTRRGYTERHELTGAGGAPLPQGILPPITVVVTTKPGQAPLTNVYAQQSSSEEGPEETGGT